MLDPTNMAGYILNLTGQDAAGGGGEKSYAMTFSSIVDDTDYVFSLVFDSGGAEETTITFTVNSGSGATLESLVAKIVAAINNDTNNTGPQDGTLSNFVVAQSDLWTPVDVSSGLWAWWDPADDSTITFSGSNITQMNDKSGNDRHLTSGGSGLALDEIHQRRY